MATKSNRLRTSTPYKAENGISTPPFALLLLLVHLLQIIKTEVIAEVFAYCQEKVKGRQWELCFLHRLPITLRAPATYFTWINKNVHITHPFIGQKLWDSYNSCKESDWTSDLLDKGCNAGKRSLKSRNDSHDGNKTNSDKKENTGQEYRQIDYKTKQGGARGHKYTQRGKCTGNRRKQDRKLH